MNKLILHQKYALIFLIPECVLHPYREGNSKKIDGRNSSIARL